jgi:hypothetical protein
MRNESTRDDRPCPRVRRRFAREVPGIEFLEGGVDVVDLEHDERRDLVVGVDLDNVEQFGEEGLGALIPGRETGMDEDEGLAAGGDDGLRYVRYAHVGGRSHDFDYGI